MKRENLNLLTLEQVCEAYPIKLRTLRYWIQNAAPRTLSRAGQKVELPGNGLASAIIRESNGRLKVGGFRAAAIQLAEEVASSRHRFLRIFISSLIEAEELAAAVRRQPDAYEFDRENQVVRLYEAEDTSLLTQQKLYHYTLLSTFAELMGWSVELMIIDRYGNSSMHDPDDLYTFAVVLPQLEYSDNGSPA